MSRKDLGFKLKAPCADCPFKKTTPFHDGVGASLPELYEGIVDKKTVVHTCHKTDPRSDGYEDNYQGQIQQCAGFTIMLRNMEQFDEVDVDNFYPGLFSSYLTSEFEPTAYVEDPDVFKNIKEMIKHYLPFLRRKRRTRIPLENGGVAFVSYNNEPSYDWGGEFEEDERD